jgi:stage II sporulation protein D
MRRFIGVLLLAVAIVATAQPPVSAATGAPRVFIIDGHGWGHGRGMGQYGARALAAAGTPWIRILPKYYSSIRIAKTPPRQRIRVLLTHGKGVVVKGDLRAVVSTVGKPIVVTKRVAMYFWIARAGNATVIQAATSASGPWHKVRAVPPRTVRITGVKAVGIVRGSTTRWYRAAIDLVPTGRGMDVINNIDLEHYVAEVVPREMPAWWPIEALKAQAVAARTYALRVASVARANHWNHDICATTACQVFGGYAWTRNGAYQILESPRANRAAFATARYFMTYKGRAILAEYSSSTGGYTTSGGVPYLAPRPDPWDASAPLHDWTETVSAAEVHAAWPTVGAVKDVRVVTRDGRGDFGGRALRVQITGSRHSIRVSASSFVAAFGLPSDWFRLRAPATPRRTVFKFTFDMGEGTHNGAVPYLQQRLHAAGFFPKGIRYSPYFGPITQSALQGYQRAHHISATGFLGPITRARLNSTK